METIGAWWWLGLLVLAILLIVLYRNGGFRLSAKGFGAGIEMEGSGKSTADKAADVAAASPTTPTPPPSAQAKGEKEVTAKGARSVAIGGGADGSTIITGDSNRIDRGRK